MWNQIAKDQQELAADEAGSGSKDQDALLSLMIGNLTSQAIADSLPSCAADTAAQPVNSGSADYENDTGNGNCSCPLSGI
jgi:hypothetical protein